jgi:putative cell wall-binding protein
VFAASSVPFTLESPKNLTAEMKYDLNGIPYFELKLDIPQSVKNIDKNIIENAEYYPGIYCDPIEIIFEYKYANYDWNEGPSVYWDTSMLVADYLEKGKYEYELVDQGGLDKIDIKSEVYQFRARFHVLSGYVDGWMDKDTYSDYSNIVTIGNAAYSERLSGADRIETAIAICREGWPDGAGTVMLARDDNYPDALTGAPLSKKLDAPILFTNSQTLTPATENEIARLKAKKVIILGGTGAVSQDIENKLRQSYVVQRIGGLDRYETAAKICQELGYKGKAIVTIGEDFHDALTVSPLAAYKGIPILLTLPDELPSSTRDALNFVAPIEITVVGNTDSVSNSVFVQLNNAKRISGSDIYEPAAPITIQVSGNNNMADMILTVEITSSSSRENLVAR